MKISSAIRESIKSHALEESPLECCGLVLDNNESSSTFRCENVSEKPTGHFSIKPSDYLKASRKGTIKAVYHSHNSDNEKFSTNDKLNSQTHQLHYFLYNTKKNTFSFFDYSKNKTLFYARIFRIGTSDCYTVIKEHYAELGINLSGENKLGDDWHEKNPHLITELFNLNKNNPDLPIVELPPSTKLQEHDVIVFEFVKGKGPNHVAVYLGNGSVLHHPRNKFPCIEMLNPIYEKKIYKVYRHEGL